MGALSSRMARDLLDKVNNPGGSFISLLSQRCSTDAEENDEVFTYLVNA